VPLGFVKTLTLQLQLFNIRFIGHISDIFKKGDTLTYMAIYR